MSENTHFGNRLVSPEEKTSLVRGVFTNVAAKYDVMNDAMSLGLHRLWKNAFVRRMDIHAGQECLDVAGGTGDIAFRIAHAGGRVTICDINHAMLSQGRIRADDRNLGQDPAWICGNAESLPFGSRRFHRYSIAFGIRNVTHIEKALAEACRVLRPGGRFFCLEFSHIPLEPVAKLYDQYSFRIIPKLGRMIAGDEESYRYLVESIRRFPPQETFSAMLREAGFAQVRHVNFTGGVVALHSGYKL